MTDEEGAWRKTREDELQYIGQCVSLCKQAGVTVRFGSVYDRRSPLLFFRTLFLIIKTSLLQQQRYDSSNKLKNETGFLSSRSMVSVKTRL